MKAHVDYYLVVALGEVLGKRTSFARALQFAQEVAKEQNLNVTIDAVEQTSVTRVNPQGNAFGRTE